MAIEEHDILAKADVDDFYMTGTHSLYGQIGRKFADSDGELVGDVIDFVLGNQFIAIKDEEGDEFMKAVCGAGMGLNMSGDIADAAFIDAHEEKFVLTTHIEKTSR